MKKRSMHTLVLMICTEALHSRQWNPSSREVFQLSSSALAPRVTPQCHPAILGCKNGNVEHPKVVDFTFWRNDLFHHHPWPCFSWKRDQTASISNIASYLGVEVQPTRTTTLALRIWYDLSLAFRHGIAIYGKNTHENTSISMEIYNDIQCWQNTY